MRQLTAILAQSKNGVIGNKGKLPWHCPEELSYFKEITEYHTILVGRKTAENIGILKHRDNIVISTDHKLGVEVWKALHDVDKGLDFFSWKKVFVIGGAEIFKVLMPRISKLIVSTLDIQVEGDTPNPFDLSHWKLKTSVNCDGKIPFVVNTYDKNL